MQLSARIAKLEGVQQASVVMATEGNLALLREAGLLNGQVDASPSDLLAVVQGEEGAACQTALEELESALSSVAEPAAGQGPQAIAPRTIQMGILEQPTANLALISTPGEYAAAEPVAAP